MLYCIFIRFFLIFSIEKKQKFDNYHYGKIAIEFCYDYFFKTFSRKLLGKFPNKISSKNRNDKNQPFNTNTNFFHISSKFEKHKNISLKATKDFNKKKKFKNIRGNKINISGLLGRKQS